jgi:hypothetical protein
MKISSLIMAILMLLTGLHLSIDAHYCGGKLFAVIFSITGLIISTFAKQF